MYTLAVLPGRQERKHFFINVYSLEKQMHGDKHLSYLKVFPTWIPNSPNPEDTSNDTFGIIMQNCHYFFWYNVFILID